MLFLLQDEQEKLKKKKRFDFLDILLAARVIETVLELPLYFKQHQRKCLEENLVFVLKEEEEEEFASRTNENLSRSLMFQDFQ